MMDGLVFTAEQSQLIISVLILLLSALTTALVGIIIWVGKREIDRIDKLEGSDNITREELEKYIARMIRSMEESVNGLRTDLRAVHARLDSHVDRRRA